MSDELKPCPFCGGVHWHRTGIRPNLHVVTCVDCGSGANLKTWNTRATPTREQIMADERVQALVEALDDICSHSASRYARNIASNALAALTESP